MDQAKKMLILKIVVIIIVALIAITIVLMTLSLSAANALLVPIEEQLSSLEKGETEAAYNLTSEQFKKSVSLEEFNNFVKTNPLLSSKNNRTFKERIIQDDAGLVKGLISSEATGGALFVEYNLIKENGQWKIIHFKVSPSPIDQ